jgi:AAHS family 4-hydroxybenzoate transporter-like MFS transporter
MGGAMPNAIALTSEYMPRRRRAGAVTMMICGFSLGAAVGGFVAASIIPVFGWPSVFVVGGIMPIAIALASFVLLPESIRFLLVGGGNESRARAYLSRMAPAEAVAVPLSPGSDEHPSTRHGAGPSTELGAGTTGAFIVAELFTNGRAMATILIWVIYFMNLLNLYFLNSWLPTIISDAGIAQATAIRLTSLFQIGGIAGAIVLGRLLDRTFSFWILAGCYAWAAAFVYAIGHSGASVAMLAVTIACAGVGIIGGQNASHALSSEFYPTHIRSTGVGWALGIGRIGSIVGPVLGGLLLTQNTPMRDVFWAALIPALIAAAAAATIAAIKRS